MSQLSEMFELNARNRPSGDHVGQALVPRPIDVTCTGFKPSLSETQISKLPERFEQNATCFPSGEGCGFISSRVDPLSCLGVPITFGPLIVTRQIFWSEISRANASRFPFVETPR